MTTSAHCATASGLRVIERDVISDFTQRLMFGHGPAEIEPY
jgi:hypothetical protein